MKTIYTMEQINAMPFNSEKDAAMIQSPHLWPCFPILPLKDASDWNRVGVVHAKHPLRVYLCNMFCLNEQANPVRHVDYESVDAILADHWSVD